MARRSDSHEQKHRRHLTNTIPEQLPERSPVSLPEKNLPKEFTVEIFAGVFWPEQSAVTIAGKKSPD
jgi:hypothetical protein